MAYTKPQQDRIDAAQKRLDAAKTSYLNNVNRYNDWVASIQRCYTDHIADSTAAATWYNPTKGPCTAKGSCDLSNCKNVIDKLNADIIPALRVAYNEQNAATANFNTVLAQVDAESGNDPANKTAHDAAVAKATGEGMAAKWKWALSIVIVVVVAFLVFAYFKWWKK